MRKTTHPKPKLDEKGFIERNLNDTRVARFLCNFIADNMHLTGEGNEVFASNGQITAFTS